MSGGAETLARYDMATGLAARLAQAAVDAAQAEGLSICAVVVDSAGLPLALLRMNSVTEPFVTAATDKAWTAAGFRRSTEALRERMATDALRSGAAARPRLLLWGGGVPVMRDGDCVGAIGVSGGTVDQDMACASAALLACGLQVAP